MLLINVIKKIVKSGKDLLTLLLINLEFCKFTFTENNIFHVVTCRFKNYYDHK